MPPIPQDSVSKKRKTEIKAVSNETASENKHNGEERKTDNHHTNKFLITTVTTIIVAVIGVFSIDLTPNTPSTQLTATITPTATLSIVDQISILGLTATKAAEITATQVFVDARNTVEVQLAVQQIENEIVTQQTQVAAETIQAAEQSQLLTATILANLTATQETFNTWHEQHQFIDEFTQDTHKWGGDTRSAHVEIDPSNGVLNFESKKESRISFWTCDSCTLPTDHDNYSFDVKYFAPSSNKDFNFGLLFGCRQFDEVLVSCLAIRIIDQSNIIIFRTGTSNEFAKKSYLINPNEMGLVSIHWEVSDETLKLWINDEQVMIDIQLDGGAGGVFGFYADPPGSTISFDRMEINPLP